MEPNEPQLTEMQLATWSEFVEEYGLADPTLTTDLAKASGACEAETVEGALAALG